MYDATKTVREFAVELPQAIRLFEKLGIDYCCGGGKPLVEACAQAKIAVDDVLRQLKENEKQAPAEIDWSTASLAEVIDFIVARHHTYVKQELPRLEQLLNKVFGKHSEKHPELSDVKEIFFALRDELTSHLMKEESVLFPYVRALEESVQGVGRPGTSCFGSVRNPIHMMELEHDSAGDALRELREVTHGYVSPEEGCFSFKALYKGLQEFEADLHQHIHMENNILHPRAIELEARSSN
jgi:regulator of cell morphogenesis and NO signaling